MRHDGVDILADPGTYCYHGEPEWREWFRSTAAHNTAEVAGVSQSESGGPFLWATQARTRTIACDVGEQPTQTWSAEHDGYLRLKIPTMHRRSLTLDSPDRSLTVVDTFDAAADVPLRLSWHLGPDIAVDLHGTRAALSWEVGSDSRQASFELPDVLDWTVHRAEVGPIAGVVLAAVRPSSPGDDTRRAGDCFDVDSPRLGAEAAMTDQITDLRSTVAALRRRRWVLAASTVVGLALGVTYVLVHPAMLTSTTLVLLPTPTLEQGSSADVATQVRIARSATVLGAAGESLEPALPARAVEKVVDVSAPTNQIIEFQAASIQASQAQLLSQAVADAYVAYVADIAQAVSSAALADLRTTRGEPADADLGAAG